MSAINQQDDMIPIFSALCLILDLYFFFTLGAISNDDIDDSFKSIPNHPYYNGAFERNQIPNMNVCIIIMSIISFIFILIFKNSASR